MDTVEKCFKPLIRLPFGLWINCGKGGRNIHSPVDESPFSFIFDLRGVDSCLPRMHTLHIFCQKPRTKADPPILRSWPK